jgi:integrase
MNFTKDLFLFGCYTGLRWSDIQQLSKSNYERREGNDWLIGVQQKTGNNYAIVLLPEAKQILDKWEWNMCRIGIATMNINLKRLACLAGIGRLLTMHMSRHTFATLAMSKGVRMEIVSKMLGHSDVKMTQIYAKVLQRDVEEGFALLASRM